MHFVDFRVRGFQSSWNTLRDRVGVSGMICLIPCFRLWPRAWMLLSIDTVRETKDTVREIQVIEFVREFMILKRQSS